ncbi:MAG: DUF456 domain-containing protein [Paludibacteraceae bacterium]|nr:DUF456 domain-containing protein [Paludibacteraceae bacterium]
MDGLLILAIFLLLLGLLGCVLPALPGLPLAYGGMVAAFFSENIDMSWQTLLVWGVVVAVMTVLDFVIPAWGTKKFGGSKRGVVGCVIGLLVGMFFGFPGIVIGPFVGAFAFELMGGMASDEALKAGFGSFIGFLLGTVLKVICCGVMAWQVGSCWVSAA